MAAWSDGKVQLDHARTLTGRILRRKCRSIGVRAVETQPALDTLEKEIIAFTLEHPAAERGGDRAPLPESQSKRRVHYRVGLI